MSEMRDTKYELWSETERRAWSLPPELTVDQWARENIELGATAPEPGPYNPDKTPFAIAPMRAFTDPEVERITMMFPAQVCKTQIILNCIGYSIAEDPADSMIVTARDEDRVRFSRKKIKPMIENSQAIKNRTTGELWDLTGTEFNFMFMTLFFGVSNSPASLATWSVKRLYFEEPDKYPPFSGREANPIDLAEKRTTTYWDRKIVTGCTPTTNNGYTYLAYNNSNKQEYYTQCPRCGEFSPWICRQLRPPDEKLRDPDKIREDGGVWLQCAICNGRIEETERDAAVSKGIYVPNGQRIDAEGRLHGKPHKSKRHSGFHFEAVISPWPGHCWKEILAQWFEANTPEGVLTGKLMDFRNSIQALPWEQSAKKLETKQMKKRIGDYSRGTVPIDCRLLVASADYHESQRQFKKIDYEVKGFGENQKCYVINSGSVSSWDDLDDIVLLSPFPWTDGTENEKRPWLAVMLLLVDSGFKSDEVYEYCRRYPGITIPTKGSPGKPKTPLVLSDLEKATERRIGKKSYRYRGMQLLNIDTEFFKDKIAGRLEIEQGQPGAIEFYAETPDYYFKELGNEHKIRIKDTRGRVRFEWRPVSPGVPTHHLDTAVLTEAAGFYKGVQYYRPPGQKIVRPAAAAGRKKIRLSELQKQKRGY